MEQAKETTNLSIRGHVGTQYESSIITLDWDIDYDTIRDSITYNNFVLFIKEWNVKGYLRRSASGNTHAMIIWDKPLDALTRFSIRAFLRDDAYRLSNDLKRIWLQDRTDVLFDEKIITQDWIDGQIKRLKKEIQTCYDEINELNKKMPMQYNASTWEEVK